MNVKAWPGLPVSFPDPGTVSSGAASGGGQVGATVEVVTTNTIADAPPAGDILFIVAGSTELQLPQASLMVGRRVTVVANDGDANPTIKPNQEHFDSLVDAGASYSQITPGTSPRSFMAQSNGNWHRV